MSEKRSSLAPVICERCERVFQGGGNAYYCPTCRRQIQSENAKKIGLSERGREARRNGNTTSGAPLQGGETPPLRSEDGRCGQRPLREVDPSSTSLHSAPSPEGEG